MQLPTLKPQEIPFDDPRSCNFFDYLSGKPFVMTVPAAKMGNVPLSPSIA